MIFNDLFLISSAPTLLSIFSTPVTHHIYTVITSFARLRSPLRPILASQVTAAIFTLRPPQFFSSPSLLPTNNIYTSPVLLTLVFLFLSLQKP